jgi:UDP-N-acetylmuramoyl-L-alanyl-D-glutamate--2,6-diaminopimelate ligase
MPAEPAMTTVAVTGTDGKTSSVEFVRQLQSHAGRRAASWGTLGLVTPGGRDPDPPTSVGPGALPALLDGLRFDGVAVASVEAYSSSLARGLLDSLSVDVAAFTNVRRDHLDYHGSFDAYLDAKTRLFERVLAPEGVAVLNADARHVEAARAVCEEEGRAVVTFGWSPGVDVRLVECEPVEAGTRVRLRAMGIERVVETGVVGDMMLENVVCAVGASVAAGTPVERVLDGVAALEPPPGRVERVADCDGAPVYVDYAHTPAALEAVLDALRPRADGRLVVVFGCGGETDPGKRGRMGAVADRFADAVFVTDDNPRREDPAAIRRAVLADCPSGVEVPDRRRAIERAVDALDAGDVLVVAGKGHETTQTVGREEREFSDRAVVREVVDARSR